MIDTMETIKILLKYKLNCFTNPLSIVLLHIIKQICLVHITVTATHNFRPKTIKCRSNSSKHMLG